MWPIDFLKEKRRSDLETLLMSHLASSDPQPKQILEEALDVISFIRQVMDQFESAMFLESFSDKYFKLKVIAKFHVIVEKLQKFDVEYEI